MVGVVVVTNTIARFLAEVNGKPEPQRTSKRPKLYTPPPEAERCTRGLPPFGYPPLRWQPLQPHRDHHLPSQLQPRMTRPHPNNHALAVRASQTLAISDSKQFPTSKQINLVINGKGGVGKSARRAASTDLFIDFLDEIRKLDKTVLAQILAQFAFSGLTRT
jgi:hypothetical protein